ncbi:oxidoreductase [Virgisporangium aliadipatigenens]|uniref:Oxidoreductase n=1 Tax=Virgisporangium aliadipatigenens TaxID=741659 RepID=A0A8J3YNP1_9ACTN|nr:SDR family oxidoreductase [Virgisporangium aliadipatigenens]GIJ47448.1 oxidoreductase [Virgisporangium aliadipatigenens]
MDLGLDGRVYVLTGASKGLGFATAEALVGDGARVVISSRDQSTVDAAVERLGDNAVGVAADLADPATAETLVTTALGRFGRIDGALISVGGPPSGIASAITDEQWLTAFHTIFLGAVRMTRTVAAALGDGGAIALVLSSSVHVPIANLAISNGLRPGLASFAKDIAEEVGPRGVRILSLLPGRISTDRSTELLAATPDPKAAEEAINRNVPLRRIGRPDEFGKVAAFLLSPAASYVNGVAVAIDGGALRII